MPSPHPRRRYTVRDVPWRLRDQLQIRAVLAPLTGPYRSRSEIPARTLRIQRWWRITAQKLHARGWPPLVASPTRLHAARTCPLTFLLVHGKPRPCHLRTACPFCWARQAAEWWDRVDAAFFQDAMDIAQPPPVFGLRAGRVIELDDVPEPRRSPRMRAPGYRLVTRIRTYPIHPYFQASSGDRADLLRDFYQARLTGTATYFRDAQPWFARTREVQDAMTAIARPGARQGCFENIVAEADRDHEVWRVSIRQVWLVPIAAELPIITPQPGVIVTERTCDHPWRTQVMKAMAQACRYPRAMLSSWRDHYPAYQLVTARQGLRLTATYGAFRKKGPAS